jgi:magnesium transporter
VRLLHVCSITRLRLAGGADSAAPSSELHEVSSLNLLGERPMITIYRGTGPDIEIVEQPSSGCWINVIDPLSEETARLAQTLSIPQDFFTYPLDMDERARIEKENGATLIVLRVPWFQGQASDVPYLTAPLGIVLGDSFIATVSKIETGVVQALIGARELSTAKRNRFLLRVLRITANLYLQDLRKIDSTVDVLEDRLQHSLRNRELRELLKYQKSLVYFTTALKSNELILRNLEKSQMFQKYPDDLDLLEDVLTEVQQAIEMTNISSNILSQMMDAFASIISNNVNSVMKFLASVTIILSLPTMIASFYGMNVPIHLSEQSWAFPLIVATSLLVCGIVGVLFWRKDWL